MRDRHPGIAIRTAALSRVYRTADRKKRIVALDQFDLEVEDGTIQGLLGPNGAGKTTLVKILSTVLLPSSGHAWVGGHDVAAETNAVRRMIGISFGGDRGLYGSLNALETLEYWSALYRVPAREAAVRIPRLLGRVGLQDRANERVSGFSRGMKQRLHLARSLVGDARVLFLDEPTSAMDPLAAHDFRKLVFDLRAEGRTILLTTHNMAEAEAVCDRIALIDHGRLIADETPRSLGQIIGHHERIDYWGGDGDLIQRIERLPGVRAVRPLDSRGHRVEVDSEGASGQVLKTIVDAGVTSISTSMPSLEEVYIHVIGDRGQRV